MTKEQKKTIKKERIYEICKEEVGRLYVMLCDKNLAETQVKEIRPLLEFISERITWRVLELLNQHYANSQKLNKTYD